MPDDGRLILGSSDCCVIVAHPDDETLWAGGTIIAHPDCNWNILALTRASDPDRKPKFLTALKALDAFGNIADLDDGPDQNPLDQNLIEQTILTSLEKISFDTIITHSPFGEYTRHRRHEETASAVINLLQTGRLQTSRLLLFAYSDHNRSEKPLPINAADITNSLEPRLFRKKLSIITDIYNFSSQSWEASICPSKEAYWQVDDVSNIADISNIKNTITERSKEL